ncbi:putative Gnk2-like domain-containing protein [Helianthus annuus]|nr:putative Gnk2-like domain-containing protein [Helianthus annuus]KAJ0851029.1 putative Gnk2-like domain-containing protein [Helianthus annuus]
MEKLMLLSVMFMFMFMLRSSHCQCSNATSGFRTNLRTLLDSLTKNAPLHEGFYQASIGNEPDQAFGILHCKPNISRNDCANCLRYPIGVMDECPENDQKETLTTSCTMKFSDKNFFGVWSNFTIASFGENGLDDPLVFSKGFSI